MAFFKFRVPGANAGGKEAAPTPSESIEAMRRRARHRLIGAVVLVLAAIIGFPLVFDTQPRPVAVDVVIQIPDRAKSGPLQLPASAAAPAAGELKPAPLATPATPAPTLAASPSPPASGHISATASLDPREQIVAANSEKNSAKPSVRPSSSATDSVEKSVTQPAKSEAKPDVKAEVKPAPKPELKPEAKAASKPASDDGARARALLEGRNFPKGPSAAAVAGAPDAAVETGRFIVQIGAFGDADKARETRLKVERAGITTYTQVVDTPEGKRTRVRVGPYTKRADAEKAAAKIRSLDLPAAILTL